MNIKSRLELAEISKLKLDLNNPRFAELYSGSEDEDDLIDYLLFNESAKDVAKGISDVGEFYSDRPLWVIQDGENYLVKDGNRRCSAIKALQNPEQYGLKLPVLNITELPILIYENIDDLNKRILQEHTNSLFREWDRISKSLETYKLFSLGNSLESMKEIDSQPSQLIKLASFYYEAVKLCGEDLKKLLRRGKGETGGKTIIFERLFKFQEKCGYKFFNKPSYKINIIEREKFESYVKSLVTYLQKNPNTKTDTIDTEGEQFLNKLIEYGFLLNYIPTESTKLDFFGAHNNSTKTNEIIDSRKNNETVKADVPIDATLDTNPNTTNTIELDNSKINSEGILINNDTRKSIKTKPIYKRKKIPSPLEKLIKECYNLDSSINPNAKTALTRVTFECTLKYIFENTKYKPTKNLCDSNYFRNVFFDGNGNKRPFTDFTKLKNLFSLLIKNVGDKKAFESFDIEFVHQIIHNYKVAAVPATADGLCDNLIALIEFMLQEEQDLLNSIDLTKL
jgi:hypothetical protein